MEKLREAIRQVQDEKRYEHTLGVAYTAANLANLYGVDIQKALRAGLLHDCAKCIPSKEKLELCKKYHIEVTALEKRNPSLTHAKLGAKVAWDVYKEQNQDVIHAIASHTTGRPGMSMLEKIIFVADYMEPGRDKAPNLLQIRKLAYENIDLAMIKILQDTLSYLKETGEEFDPATEETLNYYLSNTLE